VRTWRVLAQGTNRAIGATDLHGRVARVESLRQPFSVAIEGPIIRTNYL
jgi:hypothetical protein